MKRVLSWLCLLIAVALWPQSAFAREFYLSYDNGSGWKWSEVKFTNVGGTTWKAELPAGNGNGGNYYLKISSASINSSSTANIYHNGGNDNNLNVSDASSSSNKQYLYAYGTCNKALYISGKTNQALTIYVEEDNNNCRMWYEPVSTQITVPDNLYLSFNGNGSWVHQTSPLARSGNTFTGSLTVTNNDGYVTFSTKGITQNGDNWNTNGGKRYGPESDGQSVTDGTPYDLKEKATCWKLGSGIWNFTVSFSGEKQTVVFSQGSISTPIYWGYHGDNAKWVHNDTPLTADADGVYSFTVTNHMNHNQYFYLSDCNKSTDRLSNGFPKYRYVDPNEEIDYSLAESGNPDFARHESRSVLFVPDSKNMGVTVTFKYDATRGITDLKYTKTALPVITDERTKTNLPLRPRDFFVDEEETQAKPHYFIVGTRMGDWRLQPEWEMEKISDTQYKITTPRVMYTGLISVAKVQRYDNYSNSRYYRFSAAGNGVEIRPNNHKVTLTPKGKFAFYRDILPNKESSDRFFSNNTSGYNDDTVMKDAGVVVKEIVLTVDGNGDPVDIDFVYDTADPVTNYITLSLIGSNVINDGLPEADMTQAGLFAGGTSSSWQEAWVQYNPTTGVPYRDASGMLFYQTVFQTDWLDKHPTRFNKKIRDGHDFNYTSQSIIMRNADTFTDSELAEDAYRNYYKRFSNSSDGYLGKNGNVDQVVKIGDYIDYNEFLRTHGNGSKEDKSITYGNRTGGKWKCFVVKDMWMDDFFKIWTGWGGGRKGNDHSGAKDPNSARWYYANGGHAHEGCHSGGTKQCDASDGNGTGAEVRGYDILKKGNTVGVYGTARDKNQADFWIKNLTYFKRVIVWYDPEKGFDNSVLQLIIERCGPAIQALRGTLGSQIDYVWSIPDPANPLTDEEKALPVTRYVIQRYKLNEETNQFELNGTNPVEDVTCQNKTIGDFMTDQTATDSNLKGGTYRYRVIVTMKDALQQEVNREAWSNRVTLFDASIPVDGKAFQITEKKDGKTLYSFDMELDLDINNYLVSAKYEGKGITDLAEGYYVTIDPEVIDDFNNATRATYTCSQHEGSQSYPIDKFVVTDDPGLDQIINGQHQYTKRPWIFIPFEEGHIDRKLVWENIVTSTPGKKYSFHLFLKRNPKWETIFAAANFGRNDIEAEFVIPGVEVEYKGSRVSTYNSTPGEGKKLTEDTPASAMPMGSHNGETLVAPVHYTEANSLDALFSVSEPAVTQKVKDNFTIAYAAAPADIARENLPAVDTEGLQDLSSQTGLDVTLLSKTVQLADGRNYMAVDATKSVPVCALADVTYTLGERSMKPAEMTRAAGSATLTLGAPEFSINGRITTVEENDTKGVRYYVHDLQANVQFTNLGTQTMVTRPGFHLKPATAHGVEFERGEYGTSSKAANGGIVAHKGIFTAANGNNYTPEMYTLLDGYTPWNGEYDENSDNWAWFAKCQSTMPVFVSYFSAQKKSETEDYTKVPKLAGAISYHYPFIVEKPVAAATSAAGRAARATEKSVVALTAVGDGTMDVDLPVMTAISDVEADAVEAEYFNLQGIPVAEPQAGQVYLVRRGAEVTKELYR